MKYFTYNISKFQGIIKLALNDTLFLCGEVMKMEFGADVWWLVSLGITAVTSVIGYFLKRTMSKQDQHERDINHIKLTYVDKTELKEFKSDVNKSLDKLQQDVEDIKENSLTRKEFMASQNKIEGKIDKMYDVLLARRDNQ